MISIHLHRRIPWRLCTGFLLKIEQKKGKRKKEAVGKSGKFYLGRGRSDHLHENDTPKVERETLLIVVVGLAVYFP